MMKPMLSLLFCATPLMALRVLPVKTIDAIDQTQPVIEDLDNAERVMRKTNSKHAWVMFFGDSNMRNTYHWWVTEKVNKTGAKFMKSKQFGLTTPGKAKHWSDQEAIIEYPDGFEVRASFRFLHGSAHEFKFKTTNWHSASKAEGALYDPKYDEMKFSAGEKKQLDEAMDDPDAIQPSHYGKWAAKHQQIIDFEKEVPALATKFKEYSNVKPDVVILTEGWGGMPGCERFSETMDWFKTNPEVKFVYSPIFMTNRIESRHKCFEKKIATVPASEKPNVKFLDMWDMAKQWSRIQQMKVARTEEETVHMGQGGPYMKGACKRFEGAIDDLVK